MKKWARALYQPNLPFEAGNYVTASPAHVDLSKRAAREGMVLLKNQDNLLPLAAGQRVALFGKASFDYVKGGGGSGDVFAPYSHNLYDGLKMLGVPLYEPLSDFYREYVQKRYAAGDQPGMMKEPSLPVELVEQARAEADVAVLVLSRFSGEGWDRSNVDEQEEYNPWGHEITLPQIAGQIFPQGDFYRSKAEIQCIDAVCAAFDQVILVLNVGGVVDTAWFKDDVRVKAALLAYQGGMEACK